jgi:hypothetical protein
MVVNGVQPDNVTYNSLIHGHSSSAHWKEALRVSKAFPAKTQAMSLPHLGLAASAGKEYEPPVNIMIGAFFRVQRN